jgi:hypothetical protein
MLLVRQIWKLRGLDQVRGRRGRASDCVQLKPSQSVQFFRLPGEGCRSRNIWPDPKRTLLIEPESALIDTDGGCFRTWRVGTSFQCQVFRYVGENVAYLLNNIIS